MPPKHPRAREEEVKLPENDSDEVDLDDIDIIASPDIQDDSMISATGVNFMKWDFDNYEAKEFRLLKDQSKRYIIGIHRRYPRYINKVENYKFKYTYVDILFGRHSFSISVFDKPRELKEKMAEIANRPELKNNDYVIRLQEKESYIYGDEILIDFEPVYNALIKSQHLKLKCQVKKQGKHTHSDFV